MMNVSVGFCNPNPTPVQSAPAEEKVVESVQNPTTDKAINDIPETIPEKNAENLKKIKDIAQTSSVFKLLLTVCALLFLALLAFIGLKIYKKISDKKYIIETSPKETLATPKDFKSAINLFLGKTDD